MAWNDEITQPYCITIPLQNYDDEYLLPPEEQRKYPDFGFLLENGKPRVFNSLDAALETADSYKSMMPKHLLEIRKYFGERSYPLDIWWNKYEIGAEPVMIVGATTSDLLNHQER